MKRASLLTKCLLPAVALSRKQLYPQVTQSGVNKGQLHSRRHSRWEQWGSQGSAFPEGMTHSSPVSQLTCTLLPCTGAGLGDTVPFGYIGTCDLGRKPEILECPSLHSVLFSDGRIVIVWVECRRPLHGTENFYGEHTVSYAAIMLTDLCIQPFLISFISWLTLEKLLIFHEFTFFQLSHRYDSNNDHILRLFWELHENA